MKQKLKIVIICTALFVVISMISCKTVTQRSLVPDDVTNNSFQKEESLFIKERLSIITSAKKLLGIKYNTDGIEVNGNKFTIDCIGTIRAAFWGAGIDIAQDFYKYTGNGVARLFYSLEAQHAIKQNKIPAIGDIIFWDNTWDKNGDGKFGNDPLTHAGIVVEIDDDGTIKYLHASVHKGVTIDFMNLEAPSVWQNKDGKIINSGLYLGSYFGNPNNPPQWTAGQLFRAFGDVVTIVALYRTKN